MIMMKHEDVSGTLAVCTMYSGQAFTSFRSLSSHGRVLILVDNAVADADLLLDGLRPSYAVHRVGAADEFRRLFRVALAAGYERIHLLAHGKPGAVCFGGEWFCADNFTSDGTCKGGNAPSLHFWSCRTGSGSLGKAFVERLSYLFGSVVTAFSGVVGAAAKGGSWQPDVYSVGVSCAVVLPFSNAALYPHTLEATSESEPNNLLANATTLTLVAESLGSTKNLGDGVGTQSSPTQYSSWSDPDYWRIELLAGYQISFSITTPSSSLMPYAEFRDAADQVVAYATADASGEAARIVPYTLTASGSYYVVVGKNYYSSDGGDYELHVETAPFINDEGDDNNTIATATELVLSENPTSSGLLLGAGTGVQDPAYMYNSWSDPDYWRVELLAGDLVSVTVATPDSELNPYLELRNAADGSLVGSNGEGAGNDSFISRYEVKDSGSYYVLVGKDYYSGGGAYRFQIDVARGIQMESDANYYNGSITQANALHLSADNGDQVATVAGAIMLPESFVDKDVFALGRLNAGNTVELSTVLPSTSTLMPLVTLMHADGTPVTDFDGNRADGNFSATLLSDDDYYVQVERGYAYNGHTYVLSSSGMNWTAAQEHAELLGGHLVTINDAAEQQWITAQFSNWGNLWIGLNDEVIDSVWAWSDGAASLYRNWGDGYPYGGESYNDAYLASDGKWYSGNETWGYYALIEIENATSSTTLGSSASYVLDVRIEDSVAPRVESTTLPANNSTVDNLVGATFSVTMSEKLDPTSVKAGLREVWERDGHYYALTNSAMSWTDAEAAAVALGGHLVAMNDADEQAWLLSMLDGRYGDVWLGLSDAATENMWISADGNTTWIYGAETNSAFTNWGDSQPYYQWDENYDYAAMNSSGKWYATYSNSSNNLMRGVIEIAGTDSDTDGLPDSLDPYDNDARNAWDLREAGADGLFDTTDDVIHRLLLNGDYSVGTTVNLLIEDGSLNAGYYRFTVNTTLTDIVGNALDGDSNSTGSEPYVHYFTIAPPASMTTEGGRNNILTNATTLALHEDPSGKGLWLAYGMGNQAPAQQWNNWSDPDYWKVELQAGDLLSVYVNTPESALNPLIYLYDANGGYLTADDYSGANNDSFISRYAVGQSGTYYLQVAKYYYDAVGGSYELQVDVARGIDMESDAHYSNNPLNGANVLHFANNAGDQVATVVGAIMEPEGQPDIDVYALGRFNAGNTVTLTATLPSTSGLSPIVTLLDEAGNLLPDADVNYVDGTCHITLESDGNYYAQVERGYEYGGHTYIVSSTTMSWSNAQIYADMVGGHIVTINNADEQAWISNQFGWANSWIGMNDAALDGTWVWDNGTTVEYQNWGSGHPYTYSDYNYGYLATDGKWYSGYDTWGQRAIIEIETPHTAAASTNPLDTSYFLDIVVEDSVAPRVDATTLPTNGSTGDNLVGATFSVTLSEKLEPATVKAGLQEVWVRDGHYYALTDTAMSWVQAEAAAQVVGGHLVSISDTDEQAWLYSMLDGRYGDVWLGLSDSAVEGTWVSADGATTWVNGSQTNTAYTNWGDSQPYYQWDENYDYAAINSSGQWYASYDSNLMRGVIELEGTDSDSDGLPDSLDPYDNDARNAWDLREAGADGQFDTTDDVIHRLLLNGDYSVGTTVNLLIEDGSLNAGTYRFTANTTLTDIVGNALDSNAATSGSQPYQQFFTITPPAGVTTEGGRNNILTNAKALTLSEDPAGKGLWLAYGMGNQDPATMYNNWSDPDYWKVELQTGDLLSVYVNTPESALNPYVELHNAQGNYLTADDYAGAYDDAFISRYAVTESDTYYLQIGKYYYDTVGGSYELQVDVARGIQQENDANYSNGSLGSANLVTLREVGAEQQATISGNIMAPEGSYDYDVFALGRLNAGNTIELTTSLPLTSALAPVVTLWNAQGNMIADSDGNYTDGTFSATLMLDSDYYAQVEHGFVYNGHTYLLSRDGMSWTAAQAYAEQFGGDLVTINDEAEQQWIATQFSWANPWIGLTDAATEGTWMWSDGSSVSYENWGSGHPYTDTYYNHGYIASDGKWYSGNDNFGCHALIELDNRTSNTNSSTFDATYLLDITIGDGVSPRVEAASLPAHSSTVDNLVGATFSVTMSEKLDPSTVKAGLREVWERDGHYYTLTDSAMSWQDAEAAAVTLGGHLVSITDANEQTWLRSMLDGRYGDVWLGLNDASTEGTWIYSDNNLALYTNWGDSQPYYQWDESYDYAAINSGGKWYASYASNLMRGIIEIVGTDSDSDGLPDALDPYVADSANAWDLREAGADKMFDTPDDVIHRILLNGTYDGGTTVNLLIEDGSLNTGSYRFTANSTLTDIVGNPLDGDKNGTGGDDYVHYFTIAPPAGITTEGGRNNTQSNATALMLQNNPAGEGLWLAHGMGNQDPAQQWNNWSDPDYWKVELQAGDVLSVYINTPESALNPIIYLYDANGGYLTSDDYAGANDDSFISRYAVGQNGTYYLQVGKYYYDNVGGSYELLVDVARGIDMEYDPNYSNGALNGANALHFAADQHYQVSSVAGAIMAPENNNHDYDMFALGCFNAGNTVELSTTLPSTSSLIPLVTLFDAAGTPITDAHWNPADGTFSATLTQDSEYYAKVERGYQYNGHTYVLTTAGMYWTDAEAYAEALGGHLVTINNAAEQQWLADTFGSVNPWIGISDVADNGKWLWSDGAASSYSNWESSQPSTWGNYNYGYLNSNGWWYAGGNNWNYRALIEFESMGTLPAATDQNVTNYLLDVKVEDSVSPRVDMVSLPANNSTIEHLFGATISVTMSEKLDSVTVKAGLREVWEHNGHYYTLTDIAMSWTDAEAAAVAVGGHLVSINDTAENSWLLSMLDGRYANVWTGLNDAAIEGAWRLADNSTITYANWAPYEPYYQWDSNYDYAYMNSTGQWGASYSNNAMRGVIELSGNDTDNDGLPDVLDPYVNDPYNAWDLREAGADKTFDTTDDVIHRLTLNSKGYDGGINIHLLIEDGSLNAGSYRFIANSTLADIVGNALDGNRNGIGGDDYVHYFTIAPPAGITTEGGRNNIMHNATPLALSQDPAGRGLWLGHGIGNQDPGFAYENSIDPDYWQVELQAGDLLSISVNTPQSSLNPYLTLYDVNGNHLTASSDEGPDADAFISHYAIATTGTYYIRVDKDYYSGLGNYELQADVARGIQMESDANYANDSLSGANVLTFTQAGSQQIATIAGNMMSAGDGQVDDDTYALGTIEVGNTILLGITIPDMGDLRPVVEIYNANEELVGLDPNPSSGVARYDVTTTGAYYARVLPFTGSGSFGQYLLDAAITPTAEAQFADLAVASITASATAQSGSTIQVAWSVGNYGKVVTEQNTWNDRVVLSQNSRLGDADDLLLATVEHSGVLTAGATYNASVNVALPILLEGEVRIFVTSDVADVVEESFFEINNTAEEVVTVSLTPYADFHVAQASMPSHLVANETFTVTATIVNNGTGAPGTGIPQQSVSAWVDKLVRSSNAILGDADDEVVDMLEHTTTLEAAASYDVTFEVSLTAEQLQSHLFIVSDSTNAVFEAYDTGVNERRVNHLPEGNVLISGTALQSETLIATHTLSDADGLGDLLYQWYADGEAIAGATSATLQLGASLIGKQINVKAHYEDGYGVEESVVSMQTDVVVADTVAPTIITYAPSDNATEVDVTSTIVLQFSEAIKRGSGTISLYANSPEGTLVESYNVASSYNLNITDATLTITPSNRLNDSTHYYVVFEEGSMQDMAGNDYAGTAAYDFITVINHAPIIGIPHELSFAEKVDYATGDGPYNIATGYFNNDEWLDVIIANSRSNTVSVRFNNGDGTFSTSTDYAVGQWPISVTSADVTGDGKADIIVGNYYNDAISVLRNLGDGTFAAKQDYSTADEPSDVMAADIDDDNDIDMIAVHPNSNSISVLKNNGDNTFAPHVLYATGKHPSSLAVSDLNNDGFIDLMVTNTVGASVSVLINDTYGAFIGKVDYSVGNGPLVVISSDVDADGHADMVIGRALFGYVSVLKNNGDGTFTAQADYQLADNPASLSSADVDGDGMQDIIVGYRDELSTISVLKNNGDGTFATPVDYPAGTKSYAIASGDFNNDGQSDVVVVHYDADTFSLHLNNSADTSTTEFTEQTPVAVSSNIAVNDPDGDASWNGGCLQVQSTGNAESMDQLYLPTAAGAAIWIDSANNNALMAGTVQIGTADSTAAWGSALWHFSFNEHATNALVQEVARSIMFNNNSNTPSELERTITFTVTDTFGDEAHVAQTIAVTAVDDGNDVTAPTLTAVEPQSGDMFIAVDETLTFHFSEAVIGGNGLIALHVGSPEGEVVEEFNAQSSSQLLFNGETLSINPTADLTTGTPYYVTFGAGSVEDLAGNDFVAESPYHFTTAAELPEVHDLTGTTTFWKTGEAISDVASTMSTKLAEGGTQAIEFRNVQLNTDGSRTVEIWTTSADSVGSFQFAFAFSSGSVATWQSESDVWSLALNAERPDQLVVGGVNTTSLVSGAVHLGTLTITEPTNPDHFELLLSAGSLGSTTVAGIGIASDRTATGSDGSYQHINMIEGHYSLMSEKVATAISAVTAEDALAALKMAVGLSPNDNDSSAVSYQYLAADINHDGKVRATDALNILKMAVGIESAPENGWIFVPEIVGSEQMSRSNVDWSDADLFVDLSQDTQLDLIGIVKGDVNGSWVA
jgi:predicted DNA-binding protein (MmcQ/YjbR family)/methionine-rich copper-binding protein CopC